ncbi:MAG: hypothetical protein ACI87Q_001880 [Pseudohongiellaceae bacterium]|jgi:hypothetical protein
MKHAFNNELLKTTVKLISFLLLATQNSAILAQSENLSIDSVATASIRASTTNEEYLTQWVDSLPDHPTIPSPREIWGYTIGTPGELTQVDEIYTYFRALAAASDRVEIFQLGQSFEERDMIVVAIAEPEHLTNIETYRNI